MSERPLHVSIASNLPADMVHRAEQNVLRRAVDGQWPRQDVLTVMQALGLLPYDDGARTDALGFRAPLTAGERRRRAEQEETT